MVRPRRVRRQAGSSGSVSLLRIESVGFHGWDAIIFSLPCSAKAAGASWRVELDLSWLRRGTARRNSDDQETGSFPDDQETGTIVTWSSAGGGRNVRAGGTAEHVRAAGSRSSGPLAVGQDFGSRYHIIRLLGIGGMGAVYQAWDAELGVAVALKVIRPEVTGRSRATRSEVERRFKRELLLARQVTHKNVVRIHDLGEIDGIKYITMSFVDGDDLATRAQARGQAAGRDACCAIARAVVSGLVGGARGRRRAPRPEARQHHDRRRRRGADHGLRHRALDRGGDCDGSRGR